MSEQYWGRMKGKIIEYSADHQHGVIRGDDQKRYQFVGAEWRDSKPILVGARVDFDIDATFGAAVQIYLVDYSQNNNAITAKLEKFSNQDQSFEQFNAFDWFVKALKQSADFTGRARRREYWCFHLCYWVFALAAVILDALIGTEYILSGITVLALFLSSLAVTVRRLHDIGRSGWWILISFIPYLGSFILFIFLVKKTQPTVNAWGDPAS